MGAINRTGTADSSRAPEFTPGFFSKTKYSDSQCGWKKCSDFGGGKKNNLIQSFCHII
jgi:hypothetical protein